MANLQANLRSQYAVAMEDLARLLKSVNRLFYENTSEESSANTVTAIKNRATMKRGLRKVSGIGSHHLFQLQHDVVRALPFLELSNRSFQYRGGSLSSTKRQKVSCVSSKTSR